MSHAISVYNPQDGSTQFPPPAPGTVIPCVLGDHDAAVFVWDRVRGQGACEACYLAVKAGRLGVTAVQQQAFGL